MAKKLNIDLGVSLKRLDLIVKGLSNNQYLGNYASAFKGQGIEFADYRAYGPADDASKIDWKASKRTGKLMVKEFEEERGLNVFFLVDVSSRMLLGSVKKLKAEYAAEIVSSFSHTVLDSGDSVGMVMFSDSPLKVVHEGMGLKHFHIISNELSKLDNYGGGETNFSGVLDYALKNFPEGSLVVLISDFIGPDNFTSSLKVAAHKFDLIGIMVRDPIDLELPKGYGQVLIEDPVTHDRLLFSPKKYFKEYKDRVKNNLSFLEKLFLQNGADFLRLTTDKSFVEPLVEFFKLRNAQWK